MTTSTLTPTQLLTQARSTCRELLALLTEENAGLIKQALQKMEERLVHKKRLTLRLEQLLAEIKLQRPQWQNDSLIKQQILLLQQEVQIFQDLAAQNASLLQAAHQLRADLILAIRDAVGSQEPKAQLYGANGNLQNTNGHTRLVARNI